MYLAYEEVEKTQGPSLKAKGATQAKTDAKSVWTEYGFCFGG
jgi:hypothetical protein